MDAGDDVNEQTAAFWEELYRKKDRIWSGKVLAGIAAARSVRDLTFANRDESLADSSTSPANTNGGKPAIFLDAAPTSSGSGHSGCCLIGRVRQ